MEPLGVTKNAGAPLSFVWRSADSFIHTPLETGLFFTQLGFNILWSYLFFYLKQPILSFLEIIPLWFLIIYTTYKFYKADVLAGLCYLPYVIWVVLAVYLNYFIAVHN